MSTDHEQRARVLRGALEHALLQLKTIRHGAGSGTTPARLAVKFLALEAIIDGVLKEDDNQRKDG